MSLMLLAAAALTVAIAAVHSVLGERRIFRRLRGDGEPRLSAFQVGILWASWHLVSLFGLALAVALFCLASPTGLTNLPAVLRAAVIGSMVGGAGLVGFGTRGRHPAWIALLLVAALVAIAGDAVN
jgi:hypothetical protein